MRRLIGKLLEFAAFVQPLAWLAFGHFQLGDSDMPEIQRGLLGVGMVVASFILLVALLALAEKIGEDGKR